MKKTLRVLIVEDSEEDALLLADKMKRAGYELSFERVCTSRDMRKSLVDATWDVIISDHAMPGFDSFGALEVLKQSGKDIPFIVVSGSIGEETAVSVMKAGAHDYIMKENLKRLTPVVERELAEADIRRKRRVAEERLQRSEARYRMLFEQMMDSFALMEHVGVEAGAPEDFLYIDCNESYAASFGLPREAIIGKMMREIYPQVKNDLIERYSAVVRTGASDHFEYFSDSSQRHFEISAFRPREGRLATIIRDITLKKITEDRNALMSYLLEIINREESTNEIIKDVISILKLKYRMDAVAIRIRQGDDFPYFLQEGLSDDFLRNTNSLFKQDGCGEILCNENGNTYNGSLCGMVVTGARSRETPGFTENGSFWSNDLTGVMRGMPAGSHSMSNRSACVNAGFHSMALIPLRSGNEIIGLLHMCSRSKDWFTFDQIEFLESVGLTLGIALKRRSIEKEVRESEEKFRQLFNLESDSLFLIDKATGEILEANESAISLYGYSREELLRMKNTDISVDPDATRKVISGMAGNHTFVPVRYNKKRDGTIFPVEIAASSMNWEGRPVIIAAIRDITKRVQAESSLRESEERFNKAFRAMPEALIISRVEDGKIIEVNNSWKTILGYTREDVIGLNSLDLDIFKNPNDRQRAIDLLRTQGFVRDFELQLRKKTGEQIDTLLSIEILDISDNAYMITVLQDVTERKRAEKAIQESERFAVGTVNALTANIAILDESGGIMSVNSSWRHFARENGADESRVSKGVNYLAVCDSASGESSEGAAEFAAGIRAVMNSEMESYSQEYPCHSPSVRRWFSGRVTRFAGSGPLRVVVAHMDITGRKLAEEAISVSLSEKEALLKEVHHRVKNNLQVISSLMALQSAHMQKGSDAQAAMSDMQNRIRSMALVHEMLYQTENLSSIDFKSYVENIMSYLLKSTVMIGDNIRIESDMQSVTLGIDDAVPCGLILNELITNAVKYAFPGGRGGTVTVSLRLMGDGSLCLSVQDNGVGIPDRFMSDTTETLGLRLVRLLGKQLGGDISFSNSNGTNVSLNFRRHAR